jgi:hypothetical protein
MRVTGALPARGAEADLFIVEAPEGERVLRISRGRHGGRAEVAARLDSLAAELGDGVVRALSRGVDPATGRAWELQEYLPLGDLESLIARGPLPEADVLRLAEGLSGTLDLLHTRGIVHRDVKPANILVRSLAPLATALGDFGISSVLAAGISVKETGAANTPLYSPPESFADFAGAAGDFWGLGAVLLEAAAGRHPLAGLPVNMVMREICTRGIPVPGGLPPLVERLVRGLLVRDDRRRWRRAEVRACLDGARVDLPPGAPGAGGPGPARPRAAGRGRLTSPHPPEPRGEAGDPPRGTAGAATPETAGGPARQGGPPAGRPGRPGRRDAGGSLPRLYVPGPGAGHVRLATLAERFNRDGTGWETGAALLARGSVLAWLRQSGRRREARSLGRELTGTPHERLFTFIRLFAPDSPPAFRGVVLTLDNIVTLAKARDTPPAGGRGVLDAILDGTLKGFPQIAAAFGRPLDEAAEIILSSGGSLDLGTLACALTALQDPEPFIWGSEGPPRGLRALSFVLEAGCPLLTKDWWERNTSPDAPFPRRLLEGPLNSPATYGKAALEIRRGVAGGAYTLRRALGGPYGGEGD